MQRGTSADTATRRRPIEFALGEDTNVPTVVRRIERWSSEDSCVEKTQIRFVRMRDYKARVHLAFYASPIIDQTIVIFRRKRYSYFFCSDEGVKCATITNVKLNASDSRHINVLFAKVLK